MEIIKQLFDVASLFDITDDLTTTAETFRKYASIELQYRKLPGCNIQAVLDDIYNTALCICLRGAENAEEYALLRDGIIRIGSFIHSEKYICPINYTSFTHQTQQIKKDSPRSFLLLV